MSRYDAILFPNGKYKTFTVSFDDGVTQDLRLLELLDRYGVKGTFNLNSGLMGVDDSLDLGLGNLVSFNRIDADKISHCYNNHEVGAHTLRHLNLKGLPSRVQMHEIIRDIQQLEQLTGKSVTGLAYPYGSYNETTIELLRLAGIRYARTIQSSQGFGLPENPLMLHPTCHYMDPDLVRLTDDFLNKKEPWEVIYNLVRPMKIFHVWGHSYEMDAYNNWDTMETLLKTVSGREDVWHATNGEIMEYLDSAANLQYSADGSRIFNPTLRTIWLRLNDEDIFTIPAGETISV
jgi:peptidoglycan/xylan/chitin deacetylase (PgdA/CDA1 family)